MSEVVNSDEATTRFTLVRVIKVRMKEIETIQKKSWQRFDFNNILLCNGDVLNGSA